MQTKFKSLCQLLIFSVMCGLMILIYIGCGGDGDDDDDSYAALAESDASYGLFDSSPPGLNPPNGAAFDDVFFKNYGGQSLYRYGR